MLKNRSGRVITNILMLVFMIFSFLRWNGDPTFHVVVGIACGLFFFIHFYMNRKWLRSVAKAFSAGKLRGSTKVRFMTNIALLVIWSVAIISGLIALEVYAGKLRTSDVRVFSRIHAISTRAGGLFVAVHVYQHIGAMKIYFKRSGKRRSIHTML